MFRAMWVEGRNLNDRTQVAAVLKGAGLDPAHFGNRIASQDVKDQLKSITEEAVARGVFGAPTSFVGDQMFFGNDRLAFVELALKRRFEMNKLAAVLAAGALFAAAPAFAQTVGTCPTGGGSTQSTPVWVQFDLGSAQLHASEKPKIAEAVATAKARQVSVICLVGNTDKLGDKAMNAKLAAARSQAVAAEMMRVGLPAKNIVIAANPEAFGNLSLGGADASEKDRRVTIMFTR